jgi:TonB family protein
MHFQLEDYRPDTPTIESAISRREGILYSVVLHVALVMLAIWAPSIPWIREMTERAQQAAEAKALERMQAPREETRFVFVEPRLEISPPGPRADLSDQDGRARAERTERPPRNDLPFALGTTPEATEARAASPRPGGRPAPTPGPPAREPSPTPPDAPAATDTNALRLPDAREAPPRPAEEARLRPAPAAGGGSLTSALRDLGRYVREEAFNNPDGGTPQQIGPLQFDTKGVEFGPWVRRFIAQIKRNWFVPYAAMVLSFNVHTDGTITDLTVVQPSTVEAFTHAAYNALAASNPTQPLPPEYPSDRAFFTVTFFYNENPNSTP